MFSKTKGNLKGAATPLMALFFHQQAGPKSKGLALENHGVFGGEARRSEFIMLSGCLALGVIGSGRTERWQSFPGGKAGMAPCQTIRSRPFGHIAFPHCDLIGDPDRARPVAEACGAVSHVLAVV